MKWRWVAAAECLLLAACTPESLSTVPDSDPDADAVTAVYRCAGSGDDFTLVTRTVANGVGVFLPPDVTGVAYQVLDSMAAEGVYTNDQSGNQAHDNSRVRLRLDLQEGGATVNVGSRPPVSCTHDRRASIWEHAKLNGVDFRAVGNEPGWVLEVREQTSLYLRYDYGESELRLPVVETTSDAATRQTRFVGGKGADTLVVTLTGDPCGDTMSNERFPTRVDITLGDRVMKGCGRPLH